MYMFCSIATVALCTSGCHFDFCQKRLYVCWCCDFLAEKDSDILWDYCVLVFFCMTAAVAKTRQEEIGMVSVSYTIGRVARKMEVVWEEWKDVHACSIQRWTTVHLQKILQ